MQLIWRVSQRPKKKDTRTPEFDKIEEAHFEDITDHPDDSTPPPSSKEWQSMRIFYFILFYIQ